MNPLLRALSCGTFFNIAEVHQAVSAGELKPAVLPGAQDYTPPSENYTDTGDRNNKKFGGAENFYRFIQEELAPDLHCRFSINRAQQNLFGHSYGGLFALYSLFNHPEGFRNYLIASPSIWWNQQRILQDLPTFTRQRPQHVKENIGVRLTVGEYEQKPAPYTRLDPQRQKQLEQRAMVSQVLNLEEKLNAILNANLSVVSKIYPEETHMTGVMPALLDGLKWLFARCKAQANCEH